MKTLFAAVLLVSVIAGCSQSSAPPPANAPSQTTTHKLTWEVYDGTGDPATAAYILDGERLGRGAAGLDSLRQRIAKMPRGSQLEIVPYYAGGTVDRSYPFDESELYRYAKSKGVALQVPCAE